MHINYLHDEGNLMSVLYIQIRRNQITVRDLESKNAAECQEMLPSVTSAC